MVTPPVGRSLGLADYGQIFFFDPALATTQALTDAVPVKYTPFDANGLGVNTVPDHTDDSITVLRDGDYAVDFACSIFETVGIAFTIRMTVRINGVATLQQSLITKQLLAGGDENVPMSITTILRLARGDIVTIFVDAPLGAPFTLSTSTAQLRVMRVG